MSNNIAVGVDIGGSHITAALVDLEQHALIRNSLVRHPVDSRGSAAQVIRQWADAIAGCRSFHPKASKKVGIAMPGPFDYEQGVSYIRGLDKYEALYGVNVKQLLARELDIDPVDIFLMNDASCFLKGEVFGGAACNSNRVVGITLGTGLGSATCRNGEITDGDLYRTPYKEGVTEDYLSTRWFTRRYHELTGSEAKDVKSIREQAGHSEAARALFRDFGKHLGEVLAAYVRRHQAETVVIGGNITHAWDLFIPDTRAVLCAQDIQSSLVRAHLGEEAALLGAGSLCKGK